MASLIFVIVITGLSILISALTNEEPGWFEYYRGGIIGFFVSGVILYFVNNRRRAKELKKDQKNRYASPF